MYYVGIDVAKATFSACILKEKEKHREFSNDDLGFKKFIKWLLKNDVSEMHCGMEATGRYWRKLAGYLHVLGYKVSISNPAKIWAFRRSENLGRNKSDKIDAAVIARYCKAMNPAEWTPPLPEYESIKDMVRYVASIQKMLVSEKNRIKTNEFAPPVMAAIERHIEFLEQNLEELRSDIDELVQSKDSLKKKVELLKTNPGIGHSTATVIIGEVYGAGEFQSEKSVACYAGLSPRHKTSGTSVRGKTPLTKVGNCRLRKAMYYPALCLWRDKKMFPEFIDGMQERGKHKMVIIGAIMRKLLCLSYKILLTEKPYDPNYGKSNTDNEAA